MSELARHAMYGGAGLGVWLALWGLGLALRRFQPWTAPLWFTGGVGLGFAAVVFAFMARPLPAQEDRPLFVGVDYHLRARHTPTPAVMHFVRVALDAPGVELFVSPGDSDGTHQARARVTSEFLRESGAQLAVNASYFRPFHSNTLLDYYPHPGDPVTAIGLSISGGEVYRPPHATPDESGTVPIWFFEDGHAEIGPPPRDAPEAVSGFPLLVAGATVAWATDMQPTRRAPRVAAGLEPGGRVLWLLVVDGRQPLYSLGLDVPEVVAALRTKNVVDALMLDGGGSASLAILEGGRPRLLDTPVHGRIPSGVERPVANHIGVRARPLD